MAKVRRRHLRGAFVCGEPGLCADGFDLTFGGDGGQEFVLHFDGYECVASVARALWVVVEEQRRDLSRNQNALRGDA